MAGIETPAVANFLQRGICMVPAILSVIAFLALVVWRFVFAGPRRGPLLRAIVLTRQRHSNLLAEDLRSSQPAAVPGITECPLEDTAHRAERYLQRIPALTAATPPD